MANEFDPYRDALVVEHKTLWPEAYEGWSMEDRRRAESKLQADPQDAQELVYERMHTGFARVITVTDADLERVGEA